MPACSRSRKLQSEVLFSRLYKFFLPAAGFGGGAALAKPYWLIPMEVGFGACKLLAPQNLIAPHASIKVMKSRTIKALNQCK